MVTTTSFEMSTHHVVFLTFFEGNPVRLGITVYPPMISVRCMTVSVDYHGGIKWVTRVKSHRNITIIITCQMESISSGLRSHKPTLKLIS
jgi:hypothetical protein